MQIALDGVTKRYGPQRVLGSVSLAIEPGQIVCILGANGAGKTTLLRCLAAIAAPDSGRIFYDGEQFNRGRVDLRKRLAFLPEFPLIFPRLTVSRHIAMILGLYGVHGEDAAPRIAEHLQELHLLHVIDTPLGLLSRGQIYKSALAALLSLDPELWLLDEPFASGMDPAGISHFKRQARIAAARGRTILYSTQILEMAEKFSDRVCLIHRGQVPVFDTVANLRAHPHGEDGVLESLFRELSGGAE